AEKRTEPGRLSRRRLRYRGKVLRMTPSVFAQTLKAWTWTPSRPTGHQVIRYLMARYAQVHGREDPPADEVFEALDLPGFSYDPPTELAVNLDAGKVPGGANCLTRAAAHGLAHPVTLAGGLRSRGYRQFLSFVLQLQRMLPTESLGLGVARVATLLGTSAKTIGLYLQTAQQDGVLRKVEATPISVTRWPVTPLMWTNLIFTA